MKLNIALTLILVLAAAPVTAAVQSVTGATASTSDEEGCGSADAFVLTHTVVPSISLSVCDDCRFDDSDRYALLMSYGRAAQQAGYIVDPLNSSVLLITELGMLPNGKPYLRGVIGERQITVGDPFPGETLATVAGKLALIAVSANRAATAGR
jgi:hypothetical protein